MSPLRNRIVYNSGFLQSFTYVLVWLNIVMTTSCASDFKLFVGNMPGDVTAEEIQSVFAKFGTIHEVYTMGGTRSKSGQSSAFVRFGSHEECDRAIQEIHLKGKIRANDAALLVVKYAKPQAPRYEGVLSEMDSSISTVANSSPNCSPLPSPFSRSSPSLQSLTGLCKVFVGGMPSYVDRDDLIAIFAPFGKVESVHLMNKNKSKSGQSCGFVNFYDRVSAMGAIDALHAKYIIEEDLAPISVRFADSSDQAVPPASKRQKPLSLIEKLAQEAAQSILDNSV